MCLTRSVPKTRANHRFTYSRFRSTSGGPTMLSINLASSRYSRTNIVSSPGGGGAECGSRNAIVGTSLMGAPPLVRGRQPDLRPTFLSLLCQMYLSLCDLYPQSDKQWFKIHMSR
ncbi:hypothetical protein B0J17DRAFT_646089 [Rhizoctonia solani]|nr:hypothetical protein B0J17DRAFT_646089 [Rhizoctonia solani]